MSLLSRFCDLYPMIHEDPDPVVFELFNQDSGGSVGVISNSTGHFIFEGVRVPSFADTIVVVEIERSGWEVTTPPFGLDEVIFEDPGPDRNILLQPIGPGTFRTQPVEFGNRLVAMEAMVTAFDTGEIDTTSVVRSGNKIYVGGYGVNSWRASVSVYDATTLSHIYDINGCANGRCGKLFMNPYSGDVFVHGGGTTESKAVSAIHMLNLNGPSIAASINYHNPGDLYFMDSNTAIFTDSGRRFVYLSTTTMTADQGTPYTSTDCFPVLHGYDAGDNLVWIFCAASPYELRVMSPADAYNAQQGIQINSFSHSYWALDPETNNIFMTQSWNSPYGRVYHFNGTAINLVDTFGHASSGAVGRQVVFDSTNDRYVMVDQKMNKIWFLDRNDVKNVLGTISTAPDLDLGWAPLAHIFWYPEGDGNLYYVGHGGDLTKFAVIDATGIGSGSP